MKRTIDQSVTTSTGYLVERSRHKVSIKKVPKKAGTEVDAEAASRTYRNEHAALCAFSRVENDHRFAETLHKSMLRESLGENRRERNMRKPLLTMQHMLLASLNDRVEKTEGETETAFSEAVKDIGKKAQKLVATGTLEGIHEVRDYIRKANEKGAKED